MGTSGGYTVEDILVPLGFFACVFGFPLLRREMIHRHTMQRLQLEHGAVRPETPQPLPGIDDAPALALRLPEPHRLYALALLCRLQDAEAAQLDAHTTYLLRQARQEYLPQTLRAYLNVTPAVRANLAAQGHDAESMLREQLETLGRGIDDALRNDRVAAGKLLTQGAFLREVFQDREEVRT